jgi:general secretion pathway protein E
MKSQQTARRGDKGAGGGQRLDWRSMLGWLRDDGLVAESDVERITRRLGAGDSTLHPLVRLGGAGLQRLSDGQPLDTEALTEWLAGRCGLPYQRIDPLKADVGRVADVMSVHYAESRRALPVTLSLQEVGDRHRRALRRRLGGEIEAPHAPQACSLVVANPEDVRRYTTEFYALARSVRAAAARAARWRPAASFEQLVELGAATSALDANDQGVVQVVDWLWQYAFDQRASDIHLEPRRDIGAIRFRIDGVLHTVYQVPLGVMAAMTSRIKLLGRMDVVERAARWTAASRRAARCGRGRRAEVEMRLSTLPTAFGEKMVMRIFDPEQRGQADGGLGFGAHEAERWQELIARPHGIVLVTGPTGSGKTTTLYATLKQLATDEVNVCTIEDPIEMIEPAFNQTQVQPPSTWASPKGLRALMRQDPDIIMVGEIRDLATAEMAIQAALTGHLVFSTLHTNDAVGAITRLADLGVPPYLISATVIGVLAQRLVRTLCPACKAARRGPDPRDAGRAGAALATVGRRAALQAGGLPGVPHTGYRGRAGLYELLLMTDAARAAVHPALDIALRDGRPSRTACVPLRLAGAMKVAEG